MSGARRGRVLVGTSGWIYQHWRSFYPKGLPQRRWLEHASRVFRTLEINYSFYRLPSLENFERWAAQTPPGFLFAVKLSRYITHVKRLGDLGDAAARFMDVAYPLGAKLGPILVQLPPRFRARPDRLEALLTALNDAGAAHGLVPRVALEPRDESWWESREVLAILRAHRAALVFPHSSVHPYPAREPLTARWVYVRFHGPAGLFASPYGVSRLRSWAAKIRRWSAAGRTVFAYFNNDAKGHALRDARTLMTLTQSEAPGEDASLFPRRIESRVTRSPASRRAPSAGRSGSRRP